MDIGTTVIKRFSGGNKKVYQVVSGEVEFRYWFIHLTYYECTHGDHPYLIWNKLLKKVVL